MQGVAVNMSAQPKTGKARTRPKVNLNNPQHKTTYSNHALAAKVATFPSTGRNVNYKLGTRSVHVKL
jgi:hypothetical protein